MEPLAPGTEDEPPITYSSLNKQANEQERLLKLKAYLPNGKYDNVFELSYSNGVDMWFCKACECPVMGRVYQHELGKRHCQNMAIANNFEDKRKTSTEREEPSIQVAPGEPLPPGYEGEVERVAQIQERLDGFKVGPLVALEYLLELQDYDVAKEPWYLCILCDKKGDPRTVLTHLSSYNHISQYLQKHFPTCYRALAPYMTKQYKRNWQCTLQKVAEAIESKFGRLKPYPIDKDYFERDRMTVLQKISKGRHFSEHSGYTFEELIVHEELTKTYEDEDKEAMSSFNSVQKTVPKRRSPSPPVVARPTKKTKPPGLKPTDGIRRRSVSSVSSISSSDMSDFEDKKKRGRKPDFYRRDRSPDRKGLMPWERSNYQRRIPDYSRREFRDSRKEKLEEYRKLARAIERDCERIYKQHEKNPEKHPQYNEEWKKFWNKRYKELQAQGKDAANHDFKPEWIKFWNKKMAEIYQQEVRDQKEALRKRLGFNEEPAPIRFKIGRGKDKSPKPVPIAAQPDQDNEVIVIDDQEEDKRKRSNSPWERESPIRRERRRSLVRSKSRDRSRDKSLRKTRSRSRERFRKSRSKSKERRRSRERSYEDRRYRGNSFERDRRGKERIRTTADLPWEIERKVYHDYDDYYKPPAVMRDATRNPVVAALPDNEPDDEEVNIVGVLRLLTALEERLGSLGPKIIDLLAQALAMEKKEANSSETLLDSEINSVLFETVKEKLKGQLLAGLVDAVQERAFKKAIKKTASLVHLAGERKKERERLQAKVGPVKVPGIGSVDKAAIAKQIASALVMQGKTDVTQAELEQLINAVVGMAEASKTAGKPITTAGFLDSLSKNDDSKGASDISGHSSLESRKSPKLTKITEPMTPSPSKSSSSNMDHLSDSDLQTLLQNFKDLSTEEQHNLINYLKKLEALEPDRVERLRKFVNLGASTSTSSAIKPVRFEKDIRSGRSSPFSNRSGSLNPAAEDEVKPVKITLDSDEEDYSYEDVVKAVSKNVKAKEMEKERKIIEESLKCKNEVDLSDAKALISNLMSNFSKTASGGVNMLGLGETSKPSTSASDFAKNISNIPINVANLTNILGNAKKLNEARNDFKADFPPLLQKNEKCDFDSMITESKSKVDQISFKSEGRSFPRPRFEGNFGGGFGQQNMVSHQVRPQGFNNSYGSGYPRPGFDQPRPQRFNNPRFANNYPSNQFNPRPGGMNYNSRW